MQWLRSHRKRYTQISTLNFKVEKEQGQRKRPLQVKDIQESYFAYLFLYQPSMDPFNALGAAAAILQFVELSAKIIGTAHEIYNSDGGAAQENIRIEDVTKRVKQLSQHVENSVMQHASRNSSQTPNVIVELAQKAQSLAGQLLRSIDSLSIDRSARFQSWQALRKALRGYYQADHIKTLQIRLDGLRSELMLHLIVMISDDQSGLLRSIRSVKETCQAMRVDYVEQFLKLHEDLSSQIETQGLMLRSLLKSIERPTSQLTFPITEKDIIDSSITVQDLSSLVLEASKFTPKLMRILESLRFTEMPYRHDSIRETHRDTYSWIFDENESPLANWLSSQDGLFWVNGKAGSGKSTLFKYLVHSPQSRQLLNEWASGKQLSTASFFFWNHGNRMQKSWKGLLQSLLFQILSTCPDVAAKICPTRWNEARDLQLPPPAWRSDELVSTIELAFTEIADSYRFCFFIDGLDEYEGDDHFELISLIERLQGSESAKFCVSSRPWNVFVANFALANVPTLVLEEKTRGDMAKYIHGTLEEDRRFLRLKAREDRADELAAEISEKANGVFLWVFLVVRELLRGLNEEDDFSTLQKRLRSLPDDLEQYFQHMLNQLDRTYQEKSARALLVAAAAWSSPPIDVLYGIQYGISRSEFCRMAEVQAIDNPQREKLRNTAQFHLNSWCRDLLGISRGTDYDRVEFLHRTVRDFLCTEDIWRSLERRAGVDFNPPLVLCRASLALMTYHVHVTLDRNTSLKSTYDFKNVVLHTMYYAVECERHDENSPVNELDELNRLGNLLHSSSWVQKVWYGTDPEVDDFLTAAVACGLQLYVQEILQRQPEKLFRKRSKCPLIDFAYIENALQEFPSLPDKSSAMVRLLKLQAIQYDDKAERERKRHSLQHFLRPGKRMTAKSELQRGSYEIIF
ncbi:uncharacterized protein F4807DRAFT_455482 [Annulohypoxylon truncatum]|uniref:uncharacterized protein n=1 Tax=Annulohypoxylon truncatum TaxID=327061 RepID=UPI00200774E9|nr:uncharacterized protein F4807DRAFT_455482 [Annulohypoxylon truncatum]KAI1215033.1 hypothetical protein F4807DRAFT_455482 [Annulohypoxylon truncatum]